jgi:transportin-1
VEACEFRLTFAEDVDLVPFLTPVLLDCMVYSEDDLLWLEGDADNTDVPDKESDIKLRHYGAKSHGLESDNPANTSQSHPTSRTRIGTYGEENFDVDEDDFDFDDDDFAEEMSTEWNLRRCRACCSRRSLCWRSSRLPFGSPQGEAVEHRLASTRERHFGIGCHG